jgi:prepilin-type N-terminal cleavage/methylation domain-containing protein
MPPVGLRQARMTDAGFTLLELLVVMSVAGVLMAVGIFGFTNWRYTAQQQGSAGELVSTLRGASERAVSEGRTYCVDITGGTSFTVWKYSCGGATGTKVQGPSRVQDAAVKLTATVTTPSPAPSCPSGDSCLYFYPRGTAVPATVAVSSSRRSQVYTVHVEGLTARVWM